MGQGGKLVASPREKGRLELSPSRCTRGQPQSAADGFAYRKEAAPRDLLRGYMSDARSSQEPQLRAPQSQTPMARSYF